MNFVTFGNETINLDNVTHITVDKRIKVSFIRFTFVGGDDAVKFSARTEYDEPNLAYSEAKRWLENLQAQQEGKE